MAGRTASNTGPERTHSRPRATRPPRPFRPRPRRRRRPRRPRRPRLPPPTPGSAPTVPGAPRLPDLPGDQRLERADRRALRRRELGHDDRLDRPRPRPPHGLRVVRRIRHPVPGRDRVDPAIDRHLRLRRGLRPRRPYPIPATPLIEGGSDRHILMVDKDACRLYELFAARRSVAAGPPGAARPGTSARTPCGRETWTSADAAGLPILAGLVRYDEVAAGAIHHALRFTTNRTRTQLHLPRPPPGR